MGEGTGNGGAILMAFALGAITGAAVTLLVAPTSGDEARRLLRERAELARGRASGAAQRGREFLERQRDTLSTALERGKEAYQRARVVPEEPV